MKRIITLLVVLSFASCKREDGVEQAKKTFAGYEKTLSSIINTSSIDRSSLITINIPTHFPSGDIQEIDFDKLVDSVYYVKLETNSRCLIGNIDKIIPVDDRLIIVDRSTKESALIFSKDGSFLFEIGKKGNGPGEYISLRDVSFDEENNEILLYDGRGRKILCFDWNGKLLREKPTYFYANNFVLMQNGTIYLNKYPGSMFI